MEKANNLINNEYNRGDITKDKIKEGINLLNKIFDSKLLQNNKELGISREHSQSSNEGLSFCVFLIYLLLFFFGILILFHKIQQSKFKLKNYLEQIQ